MRRLAGLSLTVLALLVCAGCGTGGIASEESGSVSRGKELFMGEGQCAGCHALRDAGSKSTVGPDLDASFGPAREEGFKESTIREIVRQQVKYPLDASASPEVAPMPANLVEGEDLDAVAQYIATCAGNNDPAACPGPERGAEDGVKVDVTDGETIFAEAGCGTCHAFDAAGATATVGPDLDETRTPLDEAIRQIRDGGGGMPAFKDQLTKKQINAVAQFVARGGKK